MKMDNNRKTIIFDFYGVICSEIAPIWFPRYVGKTEALKLKEEYISPADLGEKSDRQLFSELGVLVSKPSEEVRQEWLDLVKINAEVVSIIKVLKKKYRIVLGSNAISDLIHQIMTEHGLNDLFDKLFISSEIHISKPDKHFFEKIIRDLDEDPENLIFIDDNPNNIEVAVKWELNPISLRQPKNWNFY